MRDFIGVVEVAVEGFAEDLILIPVDVQGRRVAMGCPVLQHRYSVASLHMGDLDQDLGVQEPQMP
jgi:hypothetical protein